MNQLEELLYSAEEHGKRHKMFNEIEKIRFSEPKLSLEQMYNKAYKKVMNT
jgi:hypothetical protein|tara:strand:- start:216 stop:368 length:153 start_codon:yes stop_codon:yes gene_type:complete